MTMKEVLIIFGERRRPVRFLSADNPAVEKKNLHEAVKSSFGDIISLESFFLQTETKKWGVVDITDDIVVENHSTVHLKTGSKEVRWSMS